MERLVMREIRETNKTTLLKLAALVLRYDILERINEDMIELVDELVDIRVKEIVPEDKEIFYNRKIEAFTCEISGNSLYVLKHRTLYDAIKYATLNIVEATVVFEDKVVVIGGYQDNDIKWIPADDKNVYRIQLGDTGEVNLENESIVMA